MHLICKRASYGYHRVDCVCLIAGIIAKFIMPGRDGGGFILTCVLGVIGAVVGGWLATMFGVGGSVSGFNLHSFLVAVVGAIVVLAIFRLLRRA